MEGLAHPLKDHIGEHEHRHEGQYHALIPEGLYPNGNHIGVVPEFPDNLGRTEVAQHRSHGQHTGIGLHGEDDSPPHPAQLTRPVVVADHGLQALAKADDHRLQEVEHLGDNGHGGHGGVPVDAGVIVQHHGGYRHHGVPEEGGESLTQDLPVNLPGSGDPAP